MADPGREPTPLNPEQPGCSAMRRINHGQWSACLGEVVYAAVWTVPHTRQRFRIFVCEQHRDVVDGARELTEADREALALRKQRWRDAMEGRGWVKPKPLPPTG